MTAADTCKMIQNLKDVQNERGRSMFYGQNMTREMETHIAQICDGQKPKNQSKIRA